MTRSTHIHLVRHGEVDNPEHVVYAALPGFGLSSLGRRQVVETAQHLAGVAIAAVVCSPLQRAVETAKAIANAHGLEPRIDPRLTEWHLADSWAGIRWDDLDEMRPGELPEYLEDPERMSAASSEPLWRLAARITAAVLDSLPASGDLVAVSHQDPVESARRTLTGRAFDAFNSNKPTHASVISIEAAGPLPWAEVDYWEPVQGEPFPPWPSEQTPNGLAR